MHEIKIQTFDSLSQELEKKIQDFRKNNPGMRGRKNSPEQKIHNDKYCSDADLKKWVIALKNDTVVGIIAIYQRIIIFDHKRVIFGGIGKVRVATTERKKGIANKMINEAMQILSDIDSDVAFLNTDIDSFLADWYRKYGFVVLDKKYTYLGATGKRYTDDDGMLAPINSPDIFSLIRDSNEVLDIGMGNW